MMDPVKPKPLQVPKLRVGAAPQHNDNDAAGDRGIAERGEDTAAFRLAIDAELDGAFAAIKEGKTDPNREVLAVEERAVSAPEIPPEQFVNDTPPEAKPPQRRRLRRITDAVSGTFRLFVTEAPSSTDGDVAASPVAEFAPSSVPDGAAAAVVAPPTKRRAKEWHFTALGWGAVAVLGITCAGMIFYKTSHSWSRSDESAGMLDENSLATQANAPTLKKGKIVVTANPADALIFLHVGDTPVTITHVDPSRSYLLRVEREGYRRTYRHVQAANFSGNSAKIDVALTPVVGTADVPAPASGIQPFATGSGDIQVTSEPPSASVWLTLGQGDAELPDRSAHFHYFMVEAPNYQTEYINVSASDFTEHGIVIRKTVNLTRGAP